MARREDDALSWDGDDDPTLDVRATDAATPVAPDAPLESAPTALPAGYAAVGRGSAERDAPAPIPETVDETGEETVDEPERAPIGNAALVSVGVLGGIYLLLAVGWLLGGARLQLIAQLFLDPIAFQVTLWLAVLAAPIWFVTVLVLTRRSRAWIRFALLALGAVLLVPWPFILAGAAL